MTKSPALRALIFDFDGTVVDTESAIYEAWRELFLSQGHDLPLSEYVQCVGATFGHYNPMTALEALTGKPLDWPLLLRTKDARIHALQTTLDTRPGIRELLLEARAAGMPCAIASSSERSHVNRWLERTGIGEFFQAVRTRDDVARAKPAPDLFLAALEALDVEPGEALVLEDSRNGLTGARAADVPCLVVPSPVTAGSDFTGAAAVLDTLAGVTLDDLRAIHERAAAVV